MTIAKFLRAAVLTAGMAAMATAVQAQQAVVTAPPVVPGLRVPSGKGTTTEAEAAAKVAAYGTQTTTGMQGAPMQPAPAVAKTAAVPKGGKVVPAALPGHVPNAPTGNPPE